MSYPSASALSLPSDVRSIVWRAMEQTVNGVVVSDATQPNNPLVYVNTGFTRMTGYPAQEVLGRNCGFLQLGDRDQPGVHRLRQGIAQGEDVTVVLRNYRRDGSLFWNRVEMSPVRDASSGRITHFFAVQTDVTLEREREEMAQVRSLELERAIGSHPMGMVTLTADGRVSLCSPAGVALLGLGDTQVLGLDVAELLQRVGQLAGVEPGRLPWPGPGQSCLWELHRPQHRVIEVSASSIGSLTGEQMAVLRDVTQQQLQQASRDHFLATAAHELRTPLGSIRGFTELMLMRAYNPEQARPLLETVLKQAVRLGGLLDDLLDLAQLDDRGREAFSLVPVDVCQVVRQAREVIELPGNRHQLVLELPASPVWVLGHGARLEQVVINLLSNAVKYSPDGGVVHCRLMQSDGPGECMLSVADQGIGLSEDDLGRLFTRFFRANPGGPIPGTGLGLSLVKEMVERMQGRVTVSSRLGEGTTFVLHLVRCTDAAMPGCAS
ncbi:MAG TPA: ATP-binding protein [Hydrogenophaga sp.]|uniref:ATP-binding protein n=1 Tax=Hydrogenophaga sp. TaxID=1904254 RepID=UPI002CBA750A|nr:ATP-binding protein [Hydrogenophaga sp.]HMN94746.1 ATP-binding protein [Hydrogenophaga sp.]HMP12079.1 ATP-binding protein [Hydrogenophaga sp.]